MLISRLSVLYAVTSSELQTKRIGSVVFKSGTKLRGGHFGGALYRRRMHEPRARNTGDASLSLYCKLCAAGGKQQEQCQSCGKQEKGTDERGEIAAGYERLIRTCPASHGGGKADRLTGEYDQKHSENTMSADIRHMCPGKPSGGQNSR